MYQVYLSRIVDEISHKIKHNNNFDLNFYFGIKAVKMWWPISIVMWIKTNLKRHQPWSCEWNFVSVFSPSYVRGRITGRHAKKGRDAAGANDLVFRGLANHGRIWNWNKKWKLVLKKNRSKFSNHYFAEGSNPTLQTKQIYI